jgi:hypothetical protein
MEQKSMRFVSFFIEDVRGGLAIVAIATRLFFFENVRLFLREFEAFLKIVILFEDKFLRY